MTKLTGLVIKAQSGFFTVQTETGPVISQIPGRLKQEWQKTDLLAAGDRVTLSLNPDGTGTIEDIVPRHSVLSRARPHPEERNLQTDREDVFIANPDQVIFVFSIRQPLPSLRKLDRFLVVAEMNHLPAVICANKVDLTGIEKAQEIFGLYETIGYRVIYTSVVQGTGIEEFRDCLHDKISVLAGSSGVGKTSLLNALQPGLGMRVRAVSQASGKGMHTTRHTELIPLDDGGYVADTPGIRSLALYDLEPDEVDGYFREIAPLVAGCQFSNCSHRHEPNCAVRAAVEDGRISSERYDSYLRLRDEQEQLQETMY
jgi:ribosome biogenesis GTPase